jgi:DNA-binding MarR family transcriptional regulator
MGEEERSVLQQREKARGALRALYLGEAVAIGRRRARALREAEEQLDKLARLLSNAVDAGIGLAEIARVADVSRPTLYQLKARYSDNPVDVRLAVLQATLERDTVREIAARLGRSVDEVAALLSEFEDRGWVGWEVDDEDGNEVVWHLGLEGLAALERWTFPEGTEGADSEDER